MSAPHHVDSTAHPTGEAALYAELCAVKAAARAFLARLKDLPSSMALIRSVAGAELDRLRKEAEKP